MTLLNSAPHSTANVLWHKRKSRIPGACYNHVVISVKHQSNWLVNFCSCYGDNLQVYKVYLFMFMINHDWRNNEATKRSIITKDIGILRDSFPPNPPPIRLTRHTTLFIGIPSAWATTSCVSVGFCVETKIVVIYSRNIFLILCIDILFSFI